MKLKKIAAGALCAATVLTMSLGTAFAASASPAATRVELQLAGSAAGPVIPLNYEVPEAIQLTAMADAKAAAANYTVQNLMTEKTLKVTAMKAESMSADWKVVPFANADQGVKDTKTIGLEAVAPDNQTKLDLVKSNPVSDVEVAKAVSGISGTATFTINAKFPEQTVDSASTKDFGNVAKIVTSVAIGK